MAAGRRERIPLHEHTFECPHCHRRTTHRSPMEQIFMARAVCEHCKKEYLIEDGAPVGKRKPHSVRSD